MQPSSERKHLSLAAPGLVLILVGFGVGSVYQSRQTSGDLGPLAGIYATLQKKYDGELDQQKLIEGAKAGFVAATGDPYTSYLTAEQAKKLNDDLQGTLSGIGAEIAIKNSQLTVVAPIDDSPAQKAGLRPGDQIRAIDGKDTTGVPLDEAVSKIRGKEGTAVKLSILRRGVQPIETTITRALIQVKSVKWSVREGVGIIELSRFGNDTDKLLAQAVSELKQQGVTKYVLDLRNNPGGFLNTSVDVTGYFISNKVVVEERRKGKQIEKLSTSSRAELEGAPLVVLINEGSASASEIVAGALQDHGAAKIVGEKSFGKGSVQEISDLSGNAQIKITVAHWFTPKGRSIDKAGIKPDITVKLEAADYDADRDPQLDKALELLR